MKVKIISIFFLAILLLQLAIAIETNVTIKTLSSSTIYFKATNPDGTIIRDSEIITDQYGDLEIIFDVPGSTYNIVETYAMKGNRINTEPQNLNSLQAGKPLYLDMMPAGVPPLINPAKAVLEEPETPAEIIEPNETEQDPNLIGTGKAVLEEINFSQTGYIITAIILLFIAGFLVFQKRSKKANKEIKVTKLSEKVQKEKDNKEGDNKLEEAERKLEELQKEIKELKERKNKSPRELEIEEAKKKLVEDEQRLIRLRRGE